MKADVIDARIGPKSDEMSGSEQALGNNRVSFDYWTPRLQLGPDSMSTYRRDSLGTFEHREIRN
jgi:hypothetical protein